jgi:hypothetical protein
MKRPSNETILLLLVSFMLPATAGVWWRVYLGHPPLNEMPRMTMSASR